MNTNSIKNTFLECFIGNIEIKNDPTELAKDMLNKCCRNCPHITNNNKAIEPEDYICKKYGATLGYMRDMTYDYLCKGRYHPFAKVDSICKKENGLEVKFTPYKKDCNTCSNKDNFVIDMCESCEDKSNYDNNNKNNKEDQEAKADLGKPKISKCPTDIIRAISIIREYGDAKYEPDSWKNVDPQRYRDAMMRHALAYIDDPYGLDEESGLPHLWHLACNVAFLCYFDKDQLYRSRKQWLIDIQKDFVKKCEEAGIPVCNEPKEVTKDDEE